MKRFGSEVPIISVNQVSRMTEVNHEKSIQNIQSLDRNLNLGTHEYQAEVGFHKFTMNLFHHLNIVARSRNSPYNVFN
jgi:hypothetical protein